MGCSASPFLIRELDFQTCFSYHLIIERACFARNCFEMRLIFDFLHEKVAQCLITCPYWMRAQVAFAHNRYLVSTDSCSSLICVIPYGRIPPSLITVLNTSKYFHIFIIHISPKYSIICPKPRTAWANIAEPTG